MDTTQKTPQKSDEVKGFPEKILNSDWEGIFQVNSARFWRQKNGQLIGLAISACELEFVHQALVTKAL